MAMSRKYYRQFAEIIRQAEYADNPREDIAAQLASMCKHDNPAFSYTKFYAECDVPMPMSDRGKR